MTRVDRIRINYTLTFQTPFHFGTGIRQSLIDRTVVRDADDYLYVPGSTFKGVVREHCEQLACLYEELDSDVRDRLISPHNEKLALRDLGYRTTMISRIFGSHNHPGSLFFDDARQSSDDKKQYDSRERGGRGRYKGLQTDLYTQVRLNRPTRTSVPGALYTSEFGLNDLSFNGSISGWLKCTPIETLENGPTYSLLLLLAGLLMLDRLGGNKSTGKGQCTCNITDLKMGGSDYKGEQWQHWLDHLDALSYYSTFAATQEEEA